MMAVIIVCIILLIMLVAFVVANLIYQHTQYYKNSIEETEKLKCKVKVNIINTGSTFAYYGIDYRYSDINGINLALKPQSLEKDFRMLKHFSNLYNDNSIVLISISDLAFCVTQYAEKEAGFKYYRILNKMEMNDYSFITALRVKYFPVTLNWKNFFRFLRDVPNNSDYGITINENDREAVQADAIMRCKNWCAEFGLKDLKNSKALELYWNIFNASCTIVGDMIDWCLNRGLRPVLINLPVSKEMSGYFSEEFVKVCYYNNIQKANEKKIPFIDLANNQKLSDYLLYLDSVRLNRSGCEVVTKLLLKELEKIGYCNA